MSATYTTAVRVHPEDSDKRQTLTGAVSFGLAAGGARIGAGLYRVTIERVQLTSAQRRYLREIKERGAPVGWGSTTVMDGRKGVSIDTLNRLETLGLIEPDGCGFKATQDGLFMLEQE